MSTCDISSEGGATNRSNRPDTSLENDRSRRTWKNVCRAGAVEDCAYDATALPKDASSSPPSTALEVCERMTCKTRLVELILECSLSVPCARPVAERPHRRRALRHWRIRSGYRS